MRFETPPKNPGSLKQLGDPVLQVLESTDSLPVDSGAGACGMCRMTPQRGPVN